ncbi:MAG: peptidoglycan DD-metalloendopeptidase family protein [Thermotaleaceae bacterium]
MLFFNKGNKSSKLTKKQSLKLTVMSAIAASTIALSGITASAAASFKLTTVYHVYLDDSYIGTVSNKEVVQEILDDKQNELREMYKDMDLQINSDVEYIAEHVFHSTANNQQASRNLENAIQLQAEAAAIVIDGQTVAYLDSKETAEQVIRTLKLQYVTEEELTDLENRQAAVTTDLPALAENQTRLIDVRLSKEVSVLEEKISPDKIMTSDEVLTILQKGTLEEKKYAVQEGDVLGTIANGHGLKLVDFLALNPGLNEDSVLKIGHEVNVTAYEPLIEIIVDKEVNQLEEIPYANVVEEDAAMPKGDSKVKQQGQNGSKSVTYMISQQNGTTITKTVTTEQVVQEPVNHIVIKGTKVIPSRGSGSLAWPAVGGYISSQMGYRWGRMHKGIDIARPSNRSILAADNGVVVSAGYDGGYGNKIVIDHQNGIRTLYAHLASINVSVGQTVSKGSTIGVMGSTGDSTGVHLHFEVFKNGVNQNPLSYVRR